MHYALIFKAGKRLQIGLYAQSDSVWGTAAIKKRRECDDAVTRVSRWAQKYRMQMTEFFSNGAQCWWGCKRRGHRSGYHSEIFPAGTCKKRQHIKN